MPSPAPANAMNTPYQKVLIAGATPAQSSVPRALLVALPFAVLCGAADAQSVPAAPALEVRAAVEVVLPVAAEHVYSLESSADLVLWNAGSETIYGTGGTESILLPAETAHGFVRARAATRPPGGLADWSLAGQSLRLNPQDASPCLMSFTAPGNGVKTAAGIEPVPFTWEWTRSGADRGTCVVAWPGGTQETFAVEYVAPGVGVFSSLQEAGAISAGGSCGTFTPAAESDPVQVPATVSGRTLVLSGTGRGVEIEFPAEGGASMTMESGKLPFSMNWQVTGAAMAQVSLSCTDGMTHLVKLNFQAGESGRYTWSSWHNGVLRREVVGAFSFSAN